MLRTEVNAKRKIHALASWRSADYALNVKLLIRICLATPIKATGMCARDHNDVLKIVYSTVYM